MTTPTEMNELHAEALEMNQLHTRTLKGDARALGDLLDWYPVTEEILDLVSQKAIRNELHSRALKMARDRAVACAP
jgi:glycerol-3-phosphate O-acyltransferase